MKFLELKEFDLLNKSKLYIVGAVMLIVILSTFFGNKEPDVVLGPTSLRISGMYGEEIPYTAIRSVDTLSSMPKITYRTNGYSFGSVNKGYFDINGYGNVLLFANSNKPPIIKIQLNDNQIVMLNWRGKPDMARVFKDLSGRLRKR